MGLYEGRGLLAKALKDLIHRWQEAKAGWDDPVSSAMETEFIEPLEMDLRSALGAMDQLAGVLSQVRQDCE